MQCDVCGGGHFAPFFSGSEWAASGRYLTAEEAADWRPARAGTGARFDLRGPIGIHLDYCLDCGFIRQDPERRVALDYAVIDRGTSQQIPHYSRDILDGLRALGVRDDAAVIEVGSNDGAFLKQLRADGFSRLLGIEPSRELASRSLAAGFETEVGYFDRVKAAELAARRGSADVVVCRHTLEHVPDIPGMLAAIADVLAPGGFCFMEVPDTDWVISRLFAHEIWDEHLAYFRPGNLALAMRRAGLEPVRLESVRFRDTANLLCWAVRSGGREIPTDVAADATAMADLKSFAARWAALTARLRADLVEAPRPIVAVGASHIQLNFLNYAGLSGAVDLLIDDDPRKAGRFAPLAGPVPICTTDQALATLTGGTILCTAFPYPGWQHRICQGLAPQGVRVVDPYAPDQAHELQTS